ncbi:MAG: phospholipase A [Burkholderiaceae bacterium]|nr:phospholipase A [Burkholderiaceae bacterium]
MPSQTRRGGLGRLGAALLVCAAAAQPALAARDDAADCVRIDDDKSRLACYDRAFDRDPIPAGANRPPLKADPGTATPPAARAAPSLFDDRWDLDGRRRGELFYPRAHKPVYLLPLNWTDRVNATPSSPSPDHSVTGPLVLRPLEVKYQLSLKAKLWERPLGLSGAIWGGYTQSSRWQVYNGAESRPFRETNYEPELIYAWPIDQHLLGWRLRLASVALNHQSNGRSLPLSRSWNRWVGEAAFERGDWTMQIRPWWRIGEAAGDDDNPDIGDYMGRSEVLLTGKLGGGIVALQLRHSLRGGSRSRGSAQLEWSVPIDGALHVYTQWFTGYGESMIDYNHKQNKLGLGISIVEWR